MSDQRGPLDAGSLWRSQACEEYEMNVQVFLNRRARELYSRTPSEIIASVTAPILFIAVVAWRFGFVHDRVVQVGTALVVTWVAISLYWLRRRIWPSRKAVAATCLVYYREELKQRREHLKSEWIWHGPMFLACIVFLAAIAERVWPVYGQLWKATPFAVALVIWAVFGFIQRRRQANELQREIDEIDQLQHS